MSDTTTKATAGTGTQPTDLTRELAALRASYPDADTAALLANTDEAACRLRRLARSGQFRTLDQLSAAMTPLQKASRAVQFAVERLGNPAAVAPDAPHPPLHEALVRLVLARREVDRLLAEALGEPLEELQGDPDLARGLAALPYYG